MKTWLLILAYHGGGNITMQPWGQFPSLRECTEAGRQVQGIKAGQGYMAATMCQEAKR